MSITSEQSRAARALLNWSQGKLAECAGVGPATLAEFESNKRTLISNDLAAIRTALEAAGVAFLDAGAVSPGPGVSLLGRNERSFDVDEDQIVQYRENLVNDAPPGAGG